MKAKITYTILLSASLVAWIAGAGGCSTTEVNPHAPPQALPPPYVQVPHPVGYDLADLRAIMTDRLAPRSEDLKDCDKDFKKLKSLTQNNDELILGARELVKQDPVKYHWCFYGQLVQLEDDLKTESFFSERQKKVLDTYSFVTPVGRAFMAEFHDSRYQRWALRYYVRLSEWIFYRKLEVTPQATAELVEASNPFGLLREPPGHMPVLEKYNILKAEGPVAPVPTAPAQSVSAVTASPTPQASVEPVREPAAEAAKPQEAQGH
ncbi:hypothetical protein WDW37_14575 [Bdellovibrionota bacterium FG-1]